jgi:HPt (histidine-containing phosphotransfer) domain-containing protein
MDKNSSKPLRKTELQEVLQCQCKSSESANACEPTTSAHLGNVLDLESLFANIGDDAELLKELRELFMLSYPNVMAELRQAIEDGQASRVQFAAHQLKGMVANFGAKTAMALAQEIENLATAEKLQSMQDAYNDVEKEMRRLTSTLESLVRSVH